MSRAPASIRSDLRLSIGPFIGTTVRSYCAISGPVWVQTEDGQILFLMPQPPKKESK